MSAIVLSDDLEPFGTEGSGHQKKFWVGRTLIKLDSKYHESDKEVSAYTLGTIFGLPMTPYAKYSYLWRDALHLGCQCSSYIGKGEVSLSLAELIADISVPMTMSAQQFFNIVTERISLRCRLDLAYVQSYILNILVFDYLICNDDRHLSNIELLYLEFADMYRFAPIFDNGLSFLRRNSMPNGGISALSSLLYKYKSAPFSTNPKRNLIDIQAAKGIALGFLRNLQANGGLNALLINDFHKRVVRAQFKTLLGDIRV